MTDFVLPFIHHKYFNFNYNYDEINYLNIYRNILHF